MANAYQTIRARLAVRSFKPDPVPDGVVDRILRAGRWAPSSRNSQPWHLIVVRDRQTLTDLASLTPSGRFIADAPMAIAVAMEGARRAELDAGRLIQNMLLAAWDEGVGTCMVGAFDGAKVKALLGIPESMEFVTAMPYGYPTEEASAKTKLRKPLSEIAHRERFGRSWEE
jgi:nitroreductase